MASDLGTATAQIDQLTAGNLQLVKEIETQVEIRELTEKVVKTTEVKVKKAVKITEKVKQSQLQVSQVFAAELDKTAVHTALTVTYDKALMRALSEEVITSLHSAHSALFVDVEQTVAGGSSPLVLEYSDEEA
jgi:3-deoxy-D-arabino-heptulosonate 7-phosphate (DAHP) synthase class II